MKGFAIVETVYSNNGLYYLAAKDAGIHLVNIHLSEADAINTALQLNFKKVSELGNKIVDYVRRTTLEHSPENTPEWSSIFRKECCKQNYSILNKFCSQCGHVLHHYVLQRPLTQTDLPSLFKYIEPFYKLIPVNIHEATNTGV